ncbi:hypothetical protein BCR35DRAFT_77004 [Leucosporidium creatinivorum]|uniref:Uncharacterized protein n=1 Tax=Leucosporidium creatinivorum TaxID=106004 RepID=A0A1Y2G347_9BASI|nr:hypothetical protein BCR35DRAFT_77004 [Leucosporidium creatinivorum]
MSVFLLPLLRCSALDLRFSLSLPHSHAMRLLLSTLIAIASYSDGGILYWENDQCIPFTLEDGTTIEQLNFCHAARCTSNRGTDCATLAIKSVWVRESYPFTSYEKITKKLGAGAVCEEVQRKRGSASMWQRS